MRKRAIGAGLAWWVVAGWAGAQTGSMRVPAVHGVTLSGERVELPEAIAGKVGVLVVGFSQASREQAGAWGGRLAGDYRTSTAVTYYEMPVLAGVPRLLRGWVLRKIAAEVPDRAKNKFLPIYDHEGEWKSAAGYGKVEDAYVLLVDSSGLVRWRCEGEASDASYGELQRRVTDLERR